MLPMIEGARSSIVGSTTILGFHQDVEGDWIADLACGHARHVRHRPPWELRPWVASEAERAQKLAVAIECPLCQMPALPPGARTYKRTNTFTETTIPSGLLRDHHTKSGIWARIVVETGVLEYRPDSPRCLFLLTPECPGIVAPTARHQVKPVGSVSFHVEFLQVTDT